MTRISREDTPTALKCAECGAPVILRTERFNSAQKQNVVRNRRYLCSADEAHAVSPPADEADA